MRRFLFLSVFVSVCVVLFTQCGNTQDNLPVGKKEKKETEDPPDPFKKLFTNAIGAREEAKKIIIGKRKEIIEKLLKLVKDPDIVKKDRAAVAAAIELLGEYRAVEAVPVLSKMLLFDSSGEVCDPKTTGGGIAFIGGPGPRAECIPAVFALTKIGMPAIKKVTDILLSIKDKTQHKNRLSLHALCIIRDVMGPELGKIYLEELMRKDKDASNSKFVNNGIHFMNEAIKRK